VNGTGNGYLPDMTDERARARAIVCELIDEIDSGSADAVTSMVDRLTEPGPDTPGRLRAVLAELLDVGATAVTALAGRPAPDAAYMVELCDADGESMNIDELDPPVRALIRALLARLAGREDDAAVQLEFALATGRREDAAEVLSIGLMWTLDALARSDR
jgi:hypothetical protein